MANLMRDAMAELAGWRDEFMSEDIEYVGQSGSVRLKARVGFSTASELDEYGVAVEVRKTDFVFRAGIVTPSPGDTIIWDGRKYRLFSTGVAPCWRFADNHGVSVRVSTKQVDK